MHKLKIGFFTYRFLYFLSKYNINNLTKDDLKNNDGIIIDKFIRFENMESDIIDLFNKINHTYDNVNLPFYNKSNRGKYFEYYDDELIELVKERDSLIINKFDYEF